MFRNRRAGPTLLLLCMPDFWSMNGCHNDGTDADRAFCNGELTSSDIQPPVENQLPKLAHRSPARTTFGFEPIQSCHSILFLEGAKRISGIPTPLYEWLEKTRLLESSLSSTTSFTYSESDTIVWANISATILTSGLNDSRYHFNDKIEEEKLKARILTNITSRGILGWNVAVTTGSALAVRIQRRKWNRLFLIHRSVRGSTTE